MDMPRNPFFARIYRQDDEAPRSLREHVAMLEVPKQFGGIYGWPEFRTDSFRSPVLVVDVSEVPEHARQLFFQPFATECLRIIPAPSEREAVEQTVPLLCDFIGDPSGIPAKQHVLAVPFFETAQAFEALGHVGASEALEITWAASSAEAGVEPPSPKEPPKKRAALADGPVAVMPRGAAASASLGAHTPKTVGAAVSLSELGGPQAEPPSRPPAWQSAGERAPAGGAASSVGSTGRMLRFGGSTWPKPPAPALAVAPNVRRVVDPSTFDTVSRMPRFFKVLGVEAFLEGVTKDRKRLADVLVLKGHQRVADGILVFGRPDASLLGGVGDNVNGKSRRVAFIKFSTVETQDAFIAIAPSLNESCPVCKKSLLADGARRVEVQQWTGPPPRA